MAWTGTPLVISLHKTVVRITGVLLAKDAVGTIGLAGGPGNISLPAGFPPDPPPTPLAPGLFLTDVICVRYNFVTEPQLLSVSKALSPFLITITSPNALTGLMNIMIEYKWWPL